ncbi:hypothetical protein C3B79_0325 [Aeromonas hydrophila]|nr:hypothetical protein C3B79_0325 [Aeromonas hydrophila]
MHTGLAGSKSGEACSHPKGPDFKRPPQIVQYFVVKKCAVRPIADLQAWWEDTLCRSTEWARPNPREWVLLPNRPSRRTRNR